MANIRIVYYIMLYYVVIKHHIIYHNISYVGKVLEAPIPKNSGLVGTKKTSLVKQFVSTHHGIAEASKHKHEEHIHIPTHMYPESYMSVDPSDLFCPWRSLNC